MFNRNVFFSSLSYFLSVWSVISPKWTNHGIIILNLQWKQFLNLDFHFFFIFKTKCVETIILYNYFTFISLFFLKVVRRRENKPAVQAAGQTLPDATPPVGKIHPFSKIAVTFERIQRFRCPPRFRISEKCQYSLSYDWKHHF